jgi:hypothetical protein
MVTEGRNDETCCWSCLSFLLRRRPQLSTLIWSREMSPLNMLIPPSASHSILRPAIPALRGSSSTRIYLRYALHNNFFLPRSRASPVHKFHATSFPSATHRTTTHIRRDWRPPGWFNSIPRHYIIFGILGINGAVFAAWSYVRMFYVSLPFVPTTPNSLCAGHSV